MAKISPKRKRFDPKNTIPLNWRIASSGQHFYRYGLSHYKNVCTDRSKWYHLVPIVSIGILFKILKFIYLLLMTTKTSDFHLYVGDFGYFIGMNFHINMTISLFFSIAGFSLIIHYYNYLCGKGEPYMKVFHMMSGQITPHSILLNDKRKVKNIFKIVKNYSHRI